MALSWSAVRKRVLGIADAPSSRTPVERYESLRSARRVVNERTTAETLHFRGTLADGIIMKLGIASAVTAIDVHLQLTRILAGSAGILFLDDMSTYLRQRRATISGKQVTDEHLIACLCSPMLTAIIRARFPHHSGQLDAADDHDESDDTAD